MHSQVLLINANYAPLAVVTLPRAMRLLARQKAEVLETDARAITTGTAGVTVARPLVLRMRSYVHARLLRRPNVSRPLVLARDGEACQYCGCRPGRAELTLDHIVPRAQGGESSWENLVAACRPCNARKGNRTPEQAGMALRSQPRRMVLPVSGRIDFGAREVWAQYGFC
jgi:5-methylcytosine-specific restriction endonuclease McrA